jgi:hypothetical protein
MSQTKYVVEIYEPDNPELVLAYFESTTPFMAFSVGDRFPRGLIAEQVLEITAIEHGIWQTNNQWVTHKIMLSTRLVQS